MDDLRNGCFPTYIAGFVGLVFLLAISGVILLYLKVDYAVIITTHLIAVPSLALATLAFALVQRRALMSRPAGDPMQAAQEVLPKSMIVKLVSAVAGIALFTVVVGGAISPVILGVILAFLIGGRLYRSRRRALERLARDCGLDYFPGDLFNLPARLGNVDPFSRGKLRTAGNVLHGLWQGHEIMAFDYEYDAHTAGFQKTHSFSACLRPLDLSFPVMLIRPEGLLDKAAEAFGGEDIRFESDEFSRRFVVRSRDRKFAYDVCNPRMMEFLLAHPGLSVVISLRSVVIFDGRRWNPGRFRSAMDFSSQVLDLIPEFVWKQYGADGGNPVA